MTRLFKITVAEHPMSDDGVFPVGTDTQVEVKAVSMHLVEDDYTFSTEAAFVLRRLPFRRVRSIKIDKLVELEPLTKGAKKAKKH